MAEEVALEWTDGGTFNTIRVPDANTFHLLFSGRESVSYAFITDDEGRAYDDPAGSYEHIMRAIRGLTRTMRNDRKDLENELERARVEARRSPLDLVAWKLDYLVRTLRFGATPGGLVRGEIRQLAIVRSYAAFTRDAITSWTCSVVERDDRSRVLSLMDAVERLEHASRGAIDRAHELQPYLPF